MPDVVAFTRRRDSSISQLVDELTEFHNAIVVASVEDFVWQFLEDFCKIQIDLGYRQEKIFDFIKYDILGYSNSNNKLYLKIRLMDDAAEIFRIKILKEKLTAEKKYIYDMIDQFSIENDLSERPISEIFDIYIDQLSNIHSKIKECDKDIFSVLSGTYSYNDKFEIVLPSVAPANWKTDKKKGQNPPDFIREHYSDYIGRGLTRADIRSLDPSLYRALTNWLQNDKHKMPIDLVLPTNRETGNSWVDRVADERLGDVKDPNVLNRLARRLEREQDNQKSK